ncbi:unnamed protein product [Closterium sp. Yama58-4]|nr:unnamed protein product [Closterium sp. Yama58-4]
MHQGFTPSMLGLQRGQDGIPPLKSQRPQSHDDDDGNDDGDDDDDEDDDDDDDEDDSDDDEDEPENEADKFGRSMTLGCKPRFQNSPVKPARGPVAAIGLKALTLASNSTAVPGRGATAGSGVSVGGTVTAAGNGASSGAAGVGSVNIGAGRNHGLANRQTGSEPGEKYSRAVTLGELDAVTTTGYRGRAGGGVRALNLGGQKAVDPKVFSMQGAGVGGISTPTMDSNGRVLVQPLGPRPAIPQYSPVQPRGSAAGAASKTGSGTGSGTGLAAGLSSKAGGGGGVGRPARTVSAIPRMEGLGGSAPGGNALRGNTSGAGALVSPTRAGFPQLAQVGEAGEGEAADLPMLPAPGLPQVVQCQHCGQLLEIPAILPPTKKGIHKLRCGKCIGLSRFRAFTPHMPHLQQQQQQPQQPQQQQQQQQPQQPQQPQQQQQQPQQPQQQPFQQQQQQVTQQHVRSSSLSAIDATKQYPCTRSSSTDSTESKTSSSDGTAATVQSPGAATNGAALKGSGAAAGLGRGRSSRGASPSPSKPLKSGLGPGRTEAGSGTGPRTGSGAGSATGTDGRGRITRIGSSESLRSISSGMPSPVGSVRDSSDNESLAGMSPVKAGSKRGEARAISASGMFRVGSGTSLAGGGGMGSPGNKVGSAGGGAGGGSGDGRLTYSRCVVVNGEPISDDHVAAAEERAGPIQSGNYWYDQVAGFWGQMGGPCLGMIPPGIELGPALPRNCSGGETKVYVNARELHRKDLDRLVKRGLPLTDNMAYRVEANGNVFDGLSGEFLWRVPGPPWEAGPIP